MITAQHHFKLAVSEALDSLSPLATGQGSAVHQILSEAQFNLNQQSTPPATEVWSGIVQLSGSLATLDLTALPRIEQSTLSLDGYYLRSLIIASPLTNTAPVNVQTGSVDGHAFLGPNGSVSIGSSLNNYHGIAQFFNMDSPLIGAASKTIDFVSTMADATAEVILTAGLPET